jgi:hypothetical protein
MYFQKREFEEAERRCEQALSVATAIGHELTIADVGCVRARISLRKGNFQDALDQAQGAAALFLRMGAAPQAATARELVTEALDRAKASEAARHLGGSARRSR